MATEAEITAMRRALALAQTPGVPRGPNPRVGAVLIDDDGTIVAEGFHRGAGTPHAEADALASAGAVARGTTAVVTLEPCNHVGRTGPCAAALLDAGVRRVVYAQSDHTVRAEGGGAALRTAGVDVESGVLVDEARSLNVAWTFAQEHTRPFVTWKFATTLDGRSAAADGTSQWITGDEARADVHALRAECDAIVVGTGTILADDPHLTVRDAVGQPAARLLQPTRVVVGLRPIPAAARVLDDAAATVQLATRNPDEVLTALYSRDCQHAWLEGGPTLAAAFLRAGLVDECVAYVAPVLLGSGRSALSDLGIPTIAEALRLRLTDVTRIGDDVRLTMSTTTAADRQPTDEGTI